MPEHGRPGVTGDHDEIACLGQSLIDVHAPALRVRSPERTMTNGLRSSSTTRGGIVFTVLRTCIV
jgi:hypothetical protein